MRSSEREIRRFRGPPRAGSTGSYTSLARSLLKNGSFWGIDRSAILYYDAQHARRRPRTRSMFSYVFPEQRIPQDHPLRAIRALVDDVLRDMSREFDRLYAAIGRPSIPPERLLRAQLLQIFYTIRRERLLMEQLDYNLLFRGFVGLPLEEPVWAPTVFTKNRARLLNQEIA